MQTRTSPDDYRYALAERFAADGDADVAATIRWCATANPGGCSVCEFLAEDDA